MTIVFILFRFVKRIVSKYDSEFCGIISYGSERIIRRISILESEKYWNIEIKLEF